MAAPVNHPYTCAVVLLTQFGYGRYTLTKDLEKWKEIKDKRLEKNLKQIPRQGGNGRAQENNQRFFVVPRTRLIETESASARAVVIAFHADMHKDGPRSGPI